MNQTRQRRWATAAVATALGLLAAVLACEGSASRPHRCCRCEYVGSSCSEFGTVPPAESGITADECRAACVRNAPGTCRSLKTFSTYRCPEDQQCNSGLASNPMQASPLGNNAALLEGPTIGTSKDATDDLRRTLRLVMATKLPGLEFGPAVVTRDRKTSTLARVIVPVNNVGTTALCDPRLLVNWKDRNGGLMAVTLPSFRGALGTGALASYCIAPGQTGYLLTLEHQTNKHVYDLVDSVEIRVEGEALAGALAPNGVVPISYRVANCEGNQRLYLTYENVSSAPNGVRLESPSTAIVLDDASTPLLWDRITVRGVDGNLTQEDFLPPGSKQEFQVEGLGEYNGRATRLVVLTRSVPAR